MDSAAALWGSFTCTKSVLPGSSSGQLRDIFELADMFALLQDNSAWGFLLTNNSSSCIHPAAERSMNCEAASIFRISFKTCLLIILMFGQRSPGRPPLSGTITTLKCWKGGVLQTMTNSWTSVNEATETKSSQREPATEEFQGCSCARTWSEARCSFRAAE